jgi:large subunit ribosomal protein L23
MAKESKKITVATIHHTERVIVKQPRLSEKAVGLNSMNQYVFTVEAAATKLQIKRHLESIYGITIARVNTVRMEGKVRRYGKSIGRTKAFKKAIVTLTKDSKKPENLEVA